MIVNTPADWLYEQLGRQRELLLIIDRLAQPDPIAQLFAVNVMHDYINLYQDSEFSDLADFGPWLVRLDPIHIPVIAELLNTPEQNWGWLASVENLDLQQIARHWRERMIIVENDQRWFYRFQDNRVIAQDLNALNDQQLPLLLGLISSVLYWDEARWLRVDNPRPADYFAPFATPWLDVPDPSPYLETSQHQNLLRWLLETHSDATTRLLESRELTPWLNEQLAQAKRWRWDSLESVQFLLEYQLIPELATHSAWSALDGETPAVHFARCRRELTLACQKIDV